MYHVTQIKAALRDHLQANLPRALDDADGAADDGVETPHPRVFWTATKNDLTDYPAVELIVTDSRPLLDTTAQVMRHRIIVGVTLTGDDEVRMQTQIERYMWALRQLIRGTQLDPPMGSAIFDTGGEQYTPTIKRQQEQYESPFVTGCFLEVFGETLE